MRYFRFGIATSLALLQIIFGTTAVTSQELEIKEKPVIINVDSGIVTNEKPIKRYAITIYQTEDEVEIECWQIIEVLELEIDGQKFKLQPGQGIYSKELITAGGFARNKQGRKLFQEEVLKKGQNECIPTEKYWRDLFKS